MNLRLSNVLKITIVFFCFCFYTNAQVGIGTTTPNPSSILEIESSTQGLLIPRVELIGTNDVSTITSGNVESLLVYNTQSINDVEPGYYYWDSSKWVRVAAGTNADNQKITNFSVTGSNLSITLENGNTATVPLADIVSVTDSNIANTNLTLDANRTLTTGNYDLNIDANTLVVDGSANEVGIGINNPTAKLDVNGTARIRTVNNGTATDNILTTDSSGNIRKRTAAEIVAAGGGNDDNIYASNGTITGNRYVNQGNYDLNFDSSTLVIDGSANEVGIGINNPAAKLDVNGDARIRLVNIGADTDYVLTRDSGGNIRRRSAAQIVTAGGGKDDNIYATNGTITSNRFVNQGSYDLNFDSNTLVIDGSSNEVGIGINSPTAKLDVNGNARIRTVANGADTDNILTRDASGNIRQRTAAQIVAAGGGNDDNIYSTNGTITANRYVSQGNYDLNFDSNTLVIDGSANEVGIGINSPTAKLDVNGDARIRIVNNGADTDNILTRDASGNIRRRTAAQIVAAGGGSDDNIYSTSGTITGNRNITQNNYDVNFDANTLVIDGSANEVGIGVSNPTAKLDVNGTAKIRTVNNGAASDNVLTRDYSGNIRKRTAAEIVAAGGGNDDNIYATSGTITGNRNITQNNYDVNFDANTLVIDGSANEVGIGINNPTAKLDVNGTARIRTVNNGAATDNILTKDASGNVRQRTAAEIVAAGGGNDDNIYSTSGTITGNRNITQNNYDVNFDANTLVIDGSANNVGIGTTYPNIDLAIGDTDTGLQQQGDGNLSIYSNNNERVRINSNGNVGVGTIAPTERFHVNGISRLGTNRSHDGDFRLHEMGTGNRNSRVQFFSDSDSANEAEIIRSSGTDGSLIIDNEGNGIMYLRNRGSGQIRLGTNNTDDFYIEDGGNVGIGINNPTAKFDVNGDARIRIVNNGADTDNILTRDASGNIRRRTAAQIVAAGGGSDDNIYSTSGTITGNRNITQNNYDVNFDANTLVIDGSANEVGIGINNPTAKLDVNGTARIRTVNNGAATDNILTKDASGNVRQRTAAEIVAAGGGNDDNIYSTSGTITGNRNITQNNYDVNFDANTLVIDGSANNVGIGTAYPNIDLAIGDTDTGLQQQGDGNLSIYSNNNERIRINSNGNVGVGTITPTERFHVNGISRLGTNRSHDGDFRLHEMGTGNRNSRVQFFSDSDSANEAEIIRSSGTDGSLIIDNEGNGIMYLRNRGSGQIRLGTNNTDDFYIEDGGNVGIGINNPTAKFDVNGTARIRTVNNGDASDNILTRDSNGNIRRRTAAQIVTAAGISNITASNGLTKSGNDVRLGGTITNNTNVLISGTNDLNFDSNTLVVDGGTNNVGVGLNNPTAKLDVNGNARIRTVDDGAATDNILTRDSSGNIRKRTAAEIVAAGGGGDDNFYSTSGTITGNRNITQNNYDVNFDANTLVIDGSSNNVGIGTTSPNIDLAIGDTDTGLQQQGDGNLSIYSNNNERIRINSNGNVGVGTITPTERFHVNGNSRLGSNNFRDGDFRINEMGTGNRNSRIQFFTDTDTANDAEIIRNNGSDGDFIIDNEGNGVMYLRSRGSGQIRLGTNNTDDFFIEDGGNVGIGISDPTAKLDISGTARIRTVNNGEDSDNILTRDSSGNIRRRTAAQIVAAGGGTEDNLYHTNGTLTSNRIINLSANTIDFNGSANDAFQVDGSTFTVDADTNRIGIGMSDPEERLNIINGNIQVGRAASLHSQMEINRIEVGINTGSVALTANDGGGNANVTFNNTARIPDVNGNAARISVNVDSSTNAAMSFELAEGVTAGTAVTTSTGMTLTTTGLGIGTTGPTEKLDINGTARVRDLSNSQNRIVYADSQGVLNIRSTRSATFARGTGANYNSSDDWRRISNASSALDVRNGDVILVNWSTIVKLTGASTTDTLNFEVRLTGSDGCSDISLSGGDFPEVNHDYFKGYNGTSGANSSCDGTYTISLWGRNLGSDNWSYNESNVTATVN
ncbi:hypothetical protein KO504_04425 [Winogradskyella psychrotolerans]|uniref:beta strand repeat-containing protein n=1 Tax=Winogradskyella psychrotolerans TaxID=1344585 RepID=UPI001C07139F|nr:hypothetical protein [Winogradskyella psychrotolerans]MBU2920577.1 hypothetical protein [Winogradskyella psychrotolerans]